MQIFERHEAIFVCLRILPVQLPCTVQVDEYVGFFQRQVSALQEPFFYMRGEQFPSDFDRGYDIFNRVDRVSFHKGIKAIWANSVKDALIYMEVNPEVLGLDTLKQMRSQLLKSCPYRFGDGDALLRDTHTKAVRMVRLSFFTLGDVNPLTPFHPLNSPGHVRLAVSQRFTQFLERHITIGIWIEIADALGHPRRCCSGPLSTF